MNIFISKPNEKTSYLKVVINVLLLCSIIVGIFWFSLSKIGIFLDFSFLQKFQSNIVQAFFMTFYLSFASLLVSLTIGTLSAIAQGSKIVILRYLARLYVSFIRGTPLIMQIYLFFYIIGTAFGIENRFLAGVLILSVFEGAYISEIIRGSLLSIEQSQLEAAKAVGFNKKQTIRYVIIPQLFARTLPALTGQFASIIKDSSLLSMIAVIELTQTMREISATNFKLFECYLFLGLLYLCLTLPISYISTLVEKRFDYEN